MSSGDPRFFARTGPHAATALAGWTAARLVLPRSGAAVPLLRGVAPLQSAATGEVSFLDNARYLTLLGGTAASLVIVSPDFAGAVPADAAALVTAKPYLVWAQVAALFHPPTAATGAIHPSAVIAPDAEIHPDAQIGPFVVIGAAAVIGARCLLEAHAVIGPGVTLGEDCRIGAHVSVSHALIGSRVTLSPGVRIGQDGFGFAPVADGFVSVPQLGRVLIGDDVEIGANTAIDRGSAQDTVIGAGCRLDNLVQIGHNVRLGRCCIVVAQAGVAGSTELEDFVTVAAQAGVNGHIRIGKRARIGAQAGVMSDVQAGAEVVGSPALPVREFFRNVATLRRLSRPRGAGREAAAGGQHRDGEREGGEGA